MHLLYGMAVMKMHSRHQPTALVQWIRSVFREGLVLTEEVARYMDSAFGTQDVGDVLANTPDSESGPLLELLCFPDRKLQLRYESRWGGNAFTADDQRAVIAELGRAPLPTAILSTSGDLLGTIEIPPFVLASVIHRLRITWQPPRRLAQALTRHYPPERQAAIRVCLRNAGLPWHAAQIRTMELFFEKMPAESDDFEAGLAFLISILSELAPEFGILDFLVAKKSFYFKALCRAERFDRRRRSSNMEIMMLQGARAAHGDAENWRHGMRMIDAICQALFGETRYFQRPESDCLNLEQGKIVQQIQNFIRILAD
jgi:hypothetical protein